MGDQANNPGRCLTGNQTSDLSVHRPTPNQLSHAGQGWNFSKSGFIIWENLSISISPLLLQCSPLEVSSEKLDYMSNLYGKPWSPTFATFWRDYWKLCSIFQPFIYSSQTDTCQVGQWCWILDFLSLPPFLLVSMCVCEREREILAFSVILKVKIVLKQARLPFLIPKNLCFYLFTFAWYTVYIFCTFLFYFRCVSIIQHGFRFCFVTKCENFLF